MNNHDPKGKQERKGFWIYIAIMTSPLLFFLVEPILWLLDVLSD